MASRRWGTVRTLPSGRHQARYLHPVTGERVVGPEPFRTKKAANDWLAEQQAQLARGTHVDYRASRVTVREVAEQWLETKLGLGRATYVSYRSFWKAQIEPVFADVEMGRLTTADVRKWIAVMAGDGLSHSRMKQTLRAFGQIVRFAEEARVLPPGQVSTRIAVPKTMSREHVVLTAAEADRLVRSMMPGRDEEMVRLLLASGLRWGELIALRTRDIEGDEIVVRRAVVNAAGRITVETPKTHQIRRVRVARADLPALPADPDALLFPDTKGGVIQYAYWRKYVWVPAKESAGLPSSLRVHDLRGTHATWLAERGVPILDIASRLGHAKATVTIQHYAQPSKRTDHVLEALDAARALD